MRQNWITIASIIVVGLLLIRLPLSFSAPLIALLVVGYMAYSNLKALQSAKTARKKQVVASLRVSSGPPCRVFVDYKPVSGDSRPRDWQLWVDYTSHGVGPALGGNGIGSSPIGPRIPNAAPDPDGKCRICIYQDGWIIKADARKEPNRSPSIQSRIRSADAAVHAAAGAYSSLFDYIAAEPAIICLSVSEGGNHRIISRLHRANLPLT